MSQLNKSIFSKTIIFLNVLLLVFVINSCSSEEENSFTPIESQVLENYYLRGDIDNEAFNIQSKIYNIPPENYDFIPYQINAINSQTDDDIDDGIESCRGLYGCGFFAFDTNEYEEANLRFADILVGDCNLQNELTTMRSFLELNDYNYDQQSDSNNTILNTVAFDYFPVNTSNSYYSSRFGDNADADFLITSVMEEPIGTFVIEGTLSCKLYYSEDNSIFKLLENGEFKVRIKNNLEE